MTGSGLAASSCSFTFSSTRGQKNNTGLLGRSCHSRVNNLRGPREEEGHHSAATLEDTWLPRLKADPRAQKGTEQATAEWTRPRPQASGYEKEVPVSTGSVALKVKGLGVSSRSGMAGVWVPHRPFHPTSDL